MSLISCRRKKPQAQRLVECLTPGSVRAASAVGLLKQTFLLHSKYVTHPPTQRHDERFSSDQFLSTTTPLQMVQRVLALISSAPAKSMDLSTAAAAVHWSRASGIPVKSFKKFVQLFPSHFIVQECPRSLVSVVSLHPASVPLLKLPPEVERLLAQRSATASPSTCTLSSSSSSQLSRGDIDICARILITLRTLAGKSNLKNNTNVSVSIFDKESLRADVHPAQVDKVLKLLPEELISASPELGTVALGPRQVAQMDAYAALLQAPKIRSDDHRLIFSLVVEPLFSELRMFESLHSNKIMLSSLEHLLHWSLVKKKLGPLNLFLELNIAALDDDAESLWKEFTLRFDGNEVILGRNATDVAVHRQIVEACSVTTTAHIPPPPPMPVKTASLITFEDYLNVTRSATAKLDLLRCVVLAVFEGIVPALAGQVLSLSSLLNLVVWVRYSGTVGSLLSFVKFFDGIFFEVVVNLDSPGERNVKLSTDGRRIIAGHDLDPQSATHIPNLTIATINTRLVSPLMLFSKVLLPFLSSATSVYLHEIYAATQWNALFAPSFGPLREFLTSSSVSPFVMLDNAKGDGIPVRLNSFQCPVEDLMVPSELADTYASLLDLFDVYVLPLLSFAHAVDVREVEDRLQWRDGFCFHPCVRAANVNPNKTPLVDVLTCVARLLEKGSSSYLVQLKRVSTRDEHPTLVQLAPRVANGSGADAVCPTMDLLKKLEDRERRRYETLLGILTALR